MELVEVWISYSSPSYCCFLPSSRWRCRIGSTYNNRSSGTELGCKVQVVKMKLYARHSGVSSGRGMVLSLIDNNANQREGDFRVASRLEQDERDVGNGVRGRSSPGQYGNRCIRLAA